MSVGSISKAGRTAPVRKPGRPRKGAGRQPMTLSKRVRAAIEVMIGEAVDRPTAAARVGLSDTSLRLAFRNPVVMAHWNSELAALRDSEKVRTLRTLVEVRDDETLKASAAGQKVRIDAAKALDGLGQAAGGVHVQVNNNLATQVNQQPGYVVAVNRRYFENMPRSMQLQTLASTSSSVVDDSGSDVTGEMRRLLGLGTLKCIAELDFAAGRKVSADAV